jgi:hypothetical protein
MQMCKDFTLSQVNGFCPWAAYKSLSSSEFLLEKGESYLLNPTKHLEKKYEKNHIS